MSPSRPAVEKKLSILAEYDFAILWPLSRRLQYPRRRWSRRLVGHQAMLSTTAHNSSKVDPVELPGPLPSRKSRLQTVKGPKGKRAFGKCDAGPFGSLTAVGPAAPAVSTSKRRESPHWARQSRGLTQSTNSQSRVHRPGKRSKFGRHFALWKRVRRGHEFNLAGVSSLLQHAFHTGLGLQYAPNPLFSRHYELF